MKDLSTLIVLIIGGIVILPFLISYIVIDNLRKKLLKD